MPNTADKLEHDRKKNNPARERETEEEKEKEKEGGGQRWRERQESQPCVECKNTLFR